MAKLARTIIGTKDGKTIKVMVFDDATVKVETVGYGGATCLNDPVVRGIEAGLGMAVETEKTAEFYQTPAQAQQRQKAGQ